MGELTEGVNWLAVGIGTVASFILGWLWYSPTLFGKQWAAGVGVELPETPSVPVVPLIFQLAATFLLAWLIAITATRDALLTAILIIATIAIFVAANDLFVKKSTAAILVETGFVVTMGVLMIVVHALV
jgi:hypothetical protein